MSWQATLWALKQRFGSTSHRFVLVMLGNYADHDGATYVGQKRLAFETGMSERSVRRVLIELEDAKLIMREERKRGSGAQSTDLIRLNLPDEGEPDKLAGSPEEPDSVTGGTGQRDRGGADSVAPLTNQRLLTSTSTQESPSGDSLPGFEKPVKTSKRAVARTYPPDWKPDLAFAVELLGVTELAAQQLADHFRDHHDARGSLFRSWPAAWQTWVRNEKKFAPGRRPHHQQPAPGQFRILRS